MDRFTLNDRYLGRLIPSITSRFAITTKIEEVRLENSKLVIKDVFQMQHFFAKNPDAGAGAAARVQALETVTNNVKWLSKYQSVVEQWITSS